MFFTPVKDRKDWGSGAVGSPVVSSPCSFISPKGQSQMKGLPPILDFANPDFIQELLHEG
jgi:hypothetical protein